MLSWHHDLTSADMALDKPQMPSGAQARSSAAEEDEEPETPVGHVPPVASTPAGLTSPTTLPKHVSATIGVVLSLTLL